MFKEITLFELKYRFSNMSTWIYFTVVLSLAFLAIFASSGVIKTFDVTIGDSSGKVHLNAPLFIFNIVSFWTYLGLLIVSAIMSNAAQRDFRHNSFPMYFTKPISKFSYLAGRFTGSYLTLLFIFSGAGIGIFLATILPVYEPEQVGAFSLFAFIQPYLVMVIPNILLMGAVFFTVTILTRKVMPVYLAAVILLVGYLLGLRFMLEIDNKILAGLIDPMGMVSSIISSIDYWTIAEKNSLLVPLEGIFLANRLLWVTFSGLVLWFGYIRFRFTHLPNLNRRKPIEASTPQIEPVQPKAIPSFKGFPISLNFSFAANMKIFINKTFYEFFWIVRNIYFIVIMFTGMLFIMINSKYVGYMYGTAGYPVTYKVLEAAGGQFIIFIMIIITFFSGEMVFRERDRKMNQITDALPVPDWVSYLSKLSAMALIQCVALVVIMISGILIQTIKGYYHYEFGLYFTELFGFTLINYVVLTVIGMMFHILVNNKYMGHFLMVMYYLSYIFLFEFGIEHNLLVIGEDGGHTYSDMNGYGPFVAPYWWFHAYWLLFACILIVVSYLFWVRGFEHTWKGRIKKAWCRFNKPLITVSALLLITFSATGCYIYYNTNILNTYRNTYESEELQFEYESMYKQFENAPQPRVMDVFVNMEIHPYERWFRAAGRYTLKNKTDEIIPAIYVTLYSEETIIHELKPDRSFELTISDVSHGFYEIHLDTPLNPGEEMVLNFDLEYRPRGFPNNGINTDLVANGTFLHSDKYLPNIGYQDSLELLKDVKRKRHGLEPKERMAAVDDLEARKNTYISNNSDWINFETIVSTAGDQTAIAPGYLQKKWTKGGRNYFHYKMDRPILHYYAYNSGRYEVKHDAWNDVAIEIYYHKGHEYNLDRMIRAIKKSLEYYTTNFSPYQHRQVRIIEFPRYQGFAQSFPNTIPYSEAIGFLAKVTDEGQDYPFEVTAHEMAHQWWAHQVIGGNVQGSTMLSESMAQYSSLMVCKQEFDPKRIREYLKYELDRYLRGRSNETKKEMPLMLVENQMYLHYNKGTIVMNALQDYIGEDCLNAALAGFIKDMAFQEPPYTNSIEFMDAIKRAAPDDKLPVIEDMFEKIILFDNEAVDANYVKQDGKFQVTLTVKAQKYESDKLGNLTELPVNDWIDIGVLNKDEELLFSDKRLIDKEEMTFVITVNEKPYQAGIDPYYNLVDRKPDNNVTRVRKG